MVQEPPEARVRENRRFYLPRFLGRSAVCDVGCGTGVFLEMLRESGVAGEGIEEDPRAAEVCRGRGFTCEVGRAQEVLAGRPGRHDALCLAHVIEHQGPEDARRLVSACAGALRPGGFLLIVAPNPADAMVMSRDFWDDPTHVRPYTVEAMRSLAAEAGLNPVAQGENPRTALHDLPAWKRIPASLLQASRRVLTGRRAGLGDLYAVLEKPA